MPARSRSRRPAAAIAAPLPPWHRLSPAALVRRPGVVTLVGATGLTLALLMAGLLDAMLEAPAFPAF